MDKTVNSTVLVGCKIPSGLVLQLREGKDVKEQHALQGAQIPHTNPLLPPPNAQREHGIGVTSVPRAFWEAWEEWAKKNKYTPYMEGFVFAAASQPELIANAKDFSHTSGLEGLRPDDKGDIRTAEFRAAALTVSKGE